MPSIGTAKDNRWAAVGNQSRRDWLPKSSTVLYEEAAMLGVPFTLCAVSSPHSFDACGLHMRCLYAKKTDESYNLVRLFSRMHYMPISHRRRRLTPSSICHLMQRESKNLCCRSKADADLCRNVCRCRCRPVWNDQSLCRR